MTASILLITTANRFVHLTHEPRLNPGVRACAHVENPAVSRGRTRVSVLGGAFNPVTNAHISLAAEICRSDTTDEVWLCPCGPRPDKPEMAPSWQRYAMCEIAVHTAVSPGFPIKLTRHEAFHTKPMATYDSLRHLEKSHPGCSFSWVVGSDWLQPGNDLRTWESEEGRTGDKLVAEFDFLVLRRPGYPVENIHLFGPRMRWIDLPHGFTMVESSCSSTEVRKRAQHDWRVDPHFGNMLQSVEGLVPAAVVSYMWRHQLYRGTTSSTINDLRPSKD